MQFSFKLCYLKKNLLFPSNEANNNMLLLSTVLCQWNFLRVLSRSKKLEFLCKYNQFVNLQITCLRGIFEIKIYSHLWSIYPAFLCVFSLCKIQPDTEMCLTGVGKGVWKLPRSMAKSLCCVVVVIFRRIGICLKPWNEDTVIHKNKT